MSTDSQDNEKKSEEKKSIMRPGGPNAWFLIALLIAFGLKYHYSRAGSDELSWILAPTASVVEHVSGIRFENEARTGFVNHQHRVIIAPSCAGVNFLITAFCMAVFYGIHRLKSRRDKLLWLTFSGMCAYFLTIGVNAVRIILSIYLYNPVNSTENPNYLRFAAGLYNLH